MIRLLYLFMMFSIVGWLWETPWVSIRTKQFVNRGFLRGPYIPIYGFAVVTIIFTMGIFENMDSNNIFVILLQFTYMGVVTALWEFVTSYVLEKIFKTRWWDYSTHKFNIQGRISLYVTVFFGLGGYFSYRVILPLFDNVLTRFSTTEVTVVLVMFYIVFMIDSVITVIELFKTKNILSQIETLSKELSTKAEAKYKEFQLQYQTSRKDFTDHVNDMKNTLIERLEQLPGQSITKKVKEEVESLNNSIQTSRRLNRFYRKYPHSKSYILFQVTKTLESLPFKRKEK